MQLGSQVNEFSSTMERIRNKQILLKENAVKLSVMKGLKEIQSALTNITFLDVLANIDVNNPVVETIQGFETQLSELRKGIEDFVVENHFDSAEDASLNPEIPVEMTPEQKKQEKEEQQKKADEEKAKISASGIKDDKSDKEKDDNSDDEDEKDAKENKKKIELSKK